jgi:hypothetical protein
MANNTILGIYHAFNHARNIILQGQIDDDYYIVDLLRELLEDEGIDLSNANDSYIQSMIYEYGDPVLISKLEQFLTSREP